MIGFEVRKRTRAVDARTCDKYRALPVANISDMMSRMDAAGARLRPMHAGGVMCGPALTVKTRPGDNLMVHKAIAMAEPGDVIVVDAGGDLTNAIIGEIMVSSARQKRLGGLVINGAIRDSDALAQWDLPVYAAGVTHRGPYKDGPGVINCPIAIDGMVIEPGDLIVGDADGLVCVPFDVVEDVYERTVAKQAQEEAALAAIARGEHNEAWIDERLNALGCRIE